MMKSTRLVKMGLFRKSYLIFQFNQFQITQYHRVSLMDIDKIEFGILDQPAFQVLFRKVYSIWQKYSLQKNQFKSIHWIKINQKYSSSLSDLRAIRLSTIYE